MRNANKSKRSGGDAPSHLGLFPTCGAPMEASLAFASSARLRVSFRSWYSQREAAARRGRPGPVIVSRRGRWGHERPRGRLRFHVQGSSRFPPGSLSLLSMVAEDPRRRWSGGAVAGRALAGVGGGPVAQKALAFTGAACSRVTRFPGRSSATTSFQLMDGRRCVRLGFEADTQQDTHLELYPGTYM